MICGFPARPTVTAGEDLVLHVGTDAPRFRVRLWRYGPSPGPVLLSDWFDGVAVPPHLPGQDWSRPSTDLTGEEVPPWPAYRIPVPADWPAGVYLADLLLDDPPAQRHPDARHPDARYPDAREGQALVVVRAGDPARRPTILYKLPLFTYHAYNQVTASAYDPATGRGGWCLYTVPAARHLPRPVPPAVSWRRPGGGTGGTPWDMHNVDPFDPTPRQTFVHWDAPFLRWLESTGYRVDYCTDLDLHEDPAGLLAGAALLVSAGHDEYWSAAMRTGVEDYVTAGGNVAFFGGNTCWWHVEFDEELDDPVSYRRLHTWSEPACGRPENGLTGVSFRNGGERDNDDYPVPVGYRVQHADSWVFAGTGLHDGEVVGGRREEYLVGYECDGAAFDRAALAVGRPVVPTGDDGTPDTFTILGVGDLTASGWGTGNRAATMGLYTRGGTVFTAATTDWPRVLAAGRSPAVERITANVLDRLGARVPPGLSG